VPAVNVSASKSKPTIPATTSVTLPTPQTINPAAVIAKKEKKRKNKEDEAAVAATLEPSGEKKVRCPYRPS